MKRIFGNSMDDINQEDDDRKNPMLGGDDSASPAEKEMDEILFSEKTAQGESLEVGDRVQTPMGHEGEIVKDLGDGRYDVLIDDPENPVVTTYLHQDLNKVSSKKTAAEVDDEPVPELGLRDVVDAIEDEAKGVEEYEELSDRAPDSEVAQILDEMADDERSHKQKLEQIVLPAVLPSQPQQTEAPAPQEVAEVPAEGQPQDKPPLLPGQVVGITPELKAKIASYVGDELVPHLWDVVEGDGLSEQQMKDRKFMSEKLAAHGYGHDSEYLNTITDDDWSYFLENFPVVVKGVEAEKKTANDRPVEEDKVKVTAKECSYYDQIGTVIEPWEEEVLVEFPDGNRRSLPYGWVEKVGSKKTSQENPILEGSTVKVASPGSEYNGQRGQVLYLSPDREIAWVRMPNGESKPFNIGELEKIYSKKTAQVYEVGEEVMLRLDPNPPVKAKVLDVIGGDVLELEYVAPSSGITRVDRYYTSQVEKISSKKAQFSPGDTAIWDKPGEAMKNVRILSISGDSAEVEDLEGEDGQSVLKGVVYQGVPVSQLKIPVRFGKKAQLYYEGETVKVTELSSPHCGQLGQIVFISPESGSLTLEFPDGSRETFSDGQTEKLAKGITGERKTAQVTTQQLNDILQRDFDFTLPELSRRMQDLMQFVEERTSQFGETVDDAVGQWVDKTDSGNLVVGGVE